MPALEPNENMETAIVEGEVTSQVKNEKEMTNNEHEVSTNVPLNNIGYSTQNRSTYEEAQQPPVYMSSTLSGTHTSHTPYRTFANSDDPSKYNSVSNSPRANGGHDFHRPYQTSPPSIDKAPSFVVRSLSESSKSTTPPSPASSPPDDKHVWTKSEIELLLDLYEGYKDQLKDPRVRKTKVWDDVARIIREKLESDVTGCQCNQKFRNLKADFQKVLDHNGRPGNFKRVCKYYDRLASILSYQAQGNRGFPHSYPPIEVHENAMARMQKHRDLYYENARTHSPKPSLKRKLSQEGMLLNPHHGLNGHPHHPDMLYMENKKPKIGACSCDCSHEVTNLKETVERINNYIVARAAHEEERMRRLEEIHREKLVALSRFVDVFKDFVMKMT